MTDNSMKSIYQKRTRIGDNILKVLIYLAAGVAIALLVGIMGYVFVRGLPQVSWQLLSTVQSSLKGTFGILGNIINTIYIIVITLIIAAPIGIGSAIYLNEYAKPGKLVRTIEFTTEILSGIPSIIFGLFGMVFFGMTLKLGYSVLDRILHADPDGASADYAERHRKHSKTVPDSYRSGALGIGATKWYMIRTILLPSAAPGILTGVILSIGSIVGESAALLFTAGSGFQLPKNLFGKLFESSGTLDHPALPVQCRKQNTIRRLESRSCFLIIVLVNQPADETF